MKSIKSLLAVAALTVAGSAFAQQPSLSSVYVGGTLGQSEFKDGCNGVSDCDKKDTAWRILGGYQFHRNIAAELGYGLMYDKSGVEVKALEAVAVGMFPIANQFSIIGKLGLANIDVNPGDDKTELTWGLGVQYDFSRNLGVRALWQRYETDEAIDFLAVGVTWKF